ncbi:vWA domain-containing protein [Fuerstiella marisgermanici]|uniref:VWFA domain-containing protein n=1 Tax=Fuerstiella marisgermanici TaxID=1891926 RepID=A0A1P8WP63_9PLAN|nr:VWA domain-containing protein [Fuerstiella marisgermanici]APZ95852.1 hypothetical protein Fuma_05515 [Fuerstiella marisgermanici]
MSDIVELEEDDGFGLVMADILFNTIGLGALLMMVLIVNQGEKAKQATDVGSLMSLIVDQRRQIEMVSKNLQEAQKENDRQREAASKQRKQRSDETAQYVQDIEKQRSDAEDRADAAEETLGKLKEADQVRLYFLVDTSASMSAGIDEVRHTLKMLSRTMPQALTSVEVGVIGFRSGKLTEFELHRIGQHGHPADLTQLETFLDELQPVSGNTCVDLAITKAIQSLGSDPNYTGSEIILLCADVGPGDSAGYHQSAGISVINRVRSWAQAAPDRRRFLSFYTASKDDTHLAFFKGLGGVTPSSRFSRQLASMFPLCFEAAFERKTQL